MRVDLTYFKETGSYYSDGVLEVPTGTDLNSIWNMVRIRQANGMLPGLEKNCGSTFYVLINVPEHPFSHPRLLLPM